MTYESQTTRAVETYASVSVPNLQLSAQHLAREDGTAVPSDLKDEYRRRTWITP